MAKRGLLGTIDWIVDVWSRWWPLITIVGGAGVIGLLSAFLAAANTFLRLFAPWSYLMAAMVAVLALVLILWAALSASRSILGWPAKPTPKPKLKPRVFPEASFFDVRLHIASSAWGRARDPDERDADINRAVLDRLADGALEAYGRLESYEVALTPIRRDFWQQARLTIGQGLARRGDARGYGYVDLHTDWPTVKRLWPR